MAADLNHIPYGGYGTPADDNWYAQAAEGDTETTNRVERSLRAIVAILGAATFGVSVGSPLGTGFSVRLAVLAAIIAVVGLLPRQPDRGWIIVALAVSGLLDAVATWLSASDSGWMLPVVVVLNGLQSLAAVGALLSETGTVRSRAAGTQTYSSYAEFVAAYQNYVAQYQQAPTQYYESGQASADAQAEAVQPAEHPADADQWSAALRAKYAQYDPLSARVTGADASRDLSISGETPRDPGVPGTTREKPRNQAQRLQQGRSGQGPSTAPGR